MNENENACIEIIWQDQIRFPGSQMGRVFWKLLKIWAQKLNNAKMST